MENFLQPTYNIDSDNEAIMRKAAELTALCDNDNDRAVSLFNFVRDEIPYSLYMISVFKENFIASRVLSWGKGYCVQKAVLLTALARAAGIPARLAFAMIRNHSIPEKIVRMAGGNVFPRHGYIQFFLDDRWISAAPTFNSGLCAKNGLPVVQFNGHDDAVLPDRDMNGNPYIEYVEKFGTYSDLPFDWIHEAISAKVGNDKRPWLDKNRTTP